MRISFDFDGSLAEPRTQRLCEKFIKDGHEVWITTARTSDPYQNIKYGWNKDVFSVAERLGIPHTNIQFTEGNGKYQYLKGFDIHFDDDRTEIELMEEHELECVGVLILDTD